MLKLETPAPAPACYTILKRIKTTESRLIDERVDTVQLSNFTIPRGGSFPRGLRVER